MDVLLPAHLLEYFWPYGGTNLTNMRFFEQEHKRSRLSDASADTQGNLVI